MPLIKEYTLEALEKAIVNAEAKRVPKLTNAAFVQIDTRILAGLIESQRERNQQGADLGLWLVCARDDDNESLDLIVWADHLGRALQLWRQWAAEFTDTAIEDFTIQPTGVYPLPKVPRVPYAHQLDWHHPAGLQDAMLHDPPAVTL